MGLLPSGGGVIKQAGPTATNLPTASRLPGLGSPRGHSTRGLSLANTSLTHLFRSVLNDTGQKGFPKPPGAFAPCFQMFPGGPQRQGKRGPWRGDLAQAETSGLRKLDPFCWRKIQPSPMAILRPGERRSETKRPGPQGMVRAYSMPSIGDKPITPPTWGERRGTSCSKARAGHDASARSIRSRGGPLTQTVQRGSR
ncbi:MAG: hypothetical protein CM15mP128_0410 [Methanobacteriota archaeon]|nr:MAG: hypothetical protein CM15mP128_0410 [Euryarchaeota archaeon]